MTDLEADVRSTLTAVTAEAPHDPGLLVRVQAGVVRRTRRRRIGAATLAAVAVAGVALVTTNPFPHRAEVFADPTGFFVDGATAVGHFPFTPTYLPPGTSRHAVLTVQASRGVREVRAQFPDVSGFNGVGNVDVAVLPGPSSPEAASTPVLVGAAPGLAWCTSDACYVGWTTATGRHLLVSVSNGARRAEEALRVARGLREQDLRETGPFAFTRAPAGCDFLPTNVGGQFIDEHQPDQAPCAVYVEQSPGEPSVEADGQDVGGGVVLGTLGQRWAVLLPLAEADRVDANQRVVLVAIARGGGWTRDRVLAFARGIHRA